VASIVNVLRPNLARVLPRFSTIDVVPAPALTEVTTIVRTPSVRAA
jgi:hypothetical protein